MVTAKVDIIIITFNQENYIDQTISSAVNQTYPNINIIIADDCSTDSTRRIIERWAFQYPEKINAIFNDINLGITANSNVALRKCTGEYFIILGGDDLLYPERVGAQVKWFEENRAAVLCGSEIDYIDEKSEIIREYKPTKKRSGRGNICWIRKGMLYGTISIMYKRSYKPTLEYDERLTQVSDLKYCIDFLGDDGDYVFLDLRLSAYRKTVRSYTISSWQQSLDDRNEMFEILKKDLNSLLLPHIKKGQNYLVNYSWGIMHLQKGNYNNALNSFLKTIKTNPTNWKAYVRIICVLIKSISS